MEQQLKGVIDVISQLPINYSDSDFQKAYLTLQEKLDVGSYLDYRENRPKEYDGIFHFALSVRVLPEGDFIPFVYITNNEKEKEEKAIKWSQESIEKKRIKYNYTSFLDDVSSILIQRKELELVDLSELLFCTYYSSTRKRFLVEEIKIDKDGSWKNPITITAEDIVGDINMLLCNHNNVDFVNLLANFYYENNSIKKLYWGLYAFDGDYLTNTKLTEFLVISQHEDEIRPFFLQRIRRIRNLSSFIRTRYTRDLLKKNRFEATKAAKAAIMSRNMSHNLGSHVMSYLKHHLCSVKDMLNDQILSQLFSDEKDFNDTMKDPVRWNEKEWFKETQEQNDSTDEDKLYATKLALPFLVGLGHFISYLQERQDFIATIATDYIPYFANVNFKDFVYDELNNDKRYNRHPDRKNLKPDNILLGNIARSEGLGRITSPTRQDENKPLCDIIIKFREHFTGDPVEAIDKPKVNPLDYYKQEDIPLAKKELDTMRKWDVSFPGGVVGRQAVFSIIENIIRNAAKHGNWRKKGELKLTIDYFTKEDLDSNKRGIKKRLSKKDNIKGELSLYEVLRRFYYNAKDSNDLFFVTLTDNLSFSKDSLVSLRKALAEEYVDESNRMINANKGIKEMRISASWLRNIEDNPQKSLISKERAELSDQKWGTEWNSNAPVLYARISKDPIVKKEGHLQYIFCLLRTQRVAFISSAFKRQPSGRLADILSDKSWKIFNTNSFLKHTNKSFDFIIYDDTTSVRKTKKIEEINILRRQSSSNFYKLSDLGCAKKEMKDIKKAIAQGIIANLTSTLDSTIVLLYRNRAKWNGLEMIHIHDAKTEQNYNNLKKDDRNKIIDKISFATNSNTKYRYVTHLEEKSEFKKYVIDEKYNNTPNNMEYETNTNHYNFIFSEGITGNNSTDRLIRTELLSEEWFFKHLYAMKQKIAIFDERIFSKVFAVEESDFILNKINNYQYKNNTQLTEKDKVTPEDRMAALNLFSQHKDEIKDCTYYKKLEKIFDKEQYDPRKGKSLSKIEARSHLGATFANKGVYVFSLIRSIEDPSVFNLYGFKENPLLDNYSECIKYAEISWNNKTGLSITPFDNDESDVLHGFNNISIHQGLLDKLYDVFDLKKDNSIKYKEILTRDFYKYFVGGKQIISFKRDEKGNNNENVNHYYLPGMTIHSGRSKPSEQDMPQQLPFIQYSAIEHAVLDCKYSLVDLLNSARYE
ncbi:MAG: hypothetical protein IK038_03770 [Bacteroidaceae bacterium]|nr:hypothetical protein [Bacteroidaceae bacterium]